MLVSTAALNRKRPVPALARRRVALVSMPFQEAGLPSIALATLAQALREHGHEVTVHHFFLEAARALGLPTYHRLSREAAWLGLVGEWLFADATITPGAADPEQYRRFVRAHPDPAFRAALAPVDLGRVRAELAHLLEHWQRGVAWHGYDVVGFTCVFQQLNASLRMAHFIKGRHPSTRVVLGGAALEGCMGEAVLARYPMLDAVFNSYAERTLCDYVKLLPERQELPIDDRAGPLDLDQLPVPSYDDYFAELARAGLAAFVDARVPIETSRGCWWGEKHHCTFCGLNGRDLRFRQKSGERVVRELKELSRYRRRFFALDNIMPHDFFSDLLPRLEREGLPYDAYYELKSNVTRTQLELLHRVGIRALQPGIESLSTSVLKTMKKGVTGIQHVWLLRTAEELDLMVGWNFLYGFPDEDVGEYPKLARLVPLVSHLPPPVRPRPVQMVRFAPLFEQSEQFGFENVRPGAAYAMAFGRHARLLDQAYFFEFDFGDRRKPEEYAADFIGAVASWVRRKQRPFAPRCELVKVGRFRFVIDTRRLDRGLRGVVPRIRRPNAHALCLLELLASPTPRATLEQEFSRTCGATPREFDETLAQLAASGLALELDQRWVRLVVIRKGGPIRELGRVTAAKLEELRDYAKTALTGFLAKYSLRVEQAQ